MSEIRYIDIHSHLHDKEFDADREAILKKLADAQTATIVIGTDYAESKKAVELAQANQNIWSSVGIHPVDKTDEVYVEEKFLYLAKQPKVVAIGECGLDYYWPTRGGWKNGEQNEKERQQKLFAAQIQIAIDLNLPLMIHGRPSEKTMDAYEDILKILEEFKVKAGDVLRGNIHFFVGTKEIAKRFLALGFTMSFTGVLTFTKQYDEVIQFLPLAAMLAETDSPYATPMPHRGERNDSSYVSLVYKRIAEIRGEDEETIRTALNANARSMFALQS